LTARRLGKQEFKTGAVAHRAELHPFTPHFRGKECEKEMTLQITENKLHEDSSWWAIYTRHQHEKVVAEMLSAKDFEVFLPLYETVRRRKDRNKKLLLPLFPCYVFVRGGLSRRLQIITTPGVHMILSKGDRVALIPENEIQTVRRIVAGPSRVEPHPFLRCGERVRVTRGALEGIEGILVRKKSLYRLVLSVDMLTQSVGVEIDASDVEPVAARSREVLNMPTSSGELSARPWVSPQTA
jgi:transcription antitermination factor NusG